VPKYLIVIAVVAVAAVVAVSIVVTMYTGNTSIARLEYEVKRIMIDDVLLDVEIADDDEKRALGLMYRDSLEEYKGMLFIFPYEGKYAFWMMNMNFSIDIIWIDSEGNVVYIVDNALPCSRVASTSECTYEPDVHAKYVLEVNGGFAERHGVTIGSRMIILD
jgi:uncharacterized membrane protein (UPF0127 family)